MKLTKDIARENSPCIYKITSPTGRIYIGQTTDLWKRYRTYKNNHVSVKYQIKLYNSLRKHGFEAHIFSIIAKCSIEELDSLERAMIRTHDSTGKKGLNCLGGGNTLRSQSQETIEKRSKKLRGKRPSKDTCLKISAANSGPLNGMFGKAPWNKGLKHSNETIEKCRKNAFRSKARLGIKHTPETLLLISSQTKGKNRGIENHNFKGFIVAFTISGEYVGRYEGLNDAASKLKLNFRMISRVLSGTQRQTGGYTFTRESV